MITIALSKGRIEKRFYQTLIDKKIINEKINETRNLKIKINKDYEIILIRSNDVIKFVEMGFADIGVVGSDILEECKNDNVTEILDLKTGICNFALASLPQSKINNINLVATKYPKISKKLLDEMNLNCKIVKMDGSLELAPLINYADAIIDLVETGNTLKANGLKVIKVLKPISTRLICKKDNVKNKEIKRLIKNLK